MQLITEYPRVVWVTRSFLDYRIPVYQSLDKLVNNRLHIIFSKDYVPDRVCSKIEQAFGKRAIGLSGEWRIGPEDNEGMANSGLSFRFHPALLTTIRRHTPDILIGDGFFKWTFTALLYKLMYRIPLVICYERTFHTERNAQWYRTLYRRAATRKADAMCCNGKLCGEYTRFLGMDSERITYGHMVADTNGLARNTSEVPSAMIQQLRSECQISGTLFLYVGSLSPRKGVRQLLEAWTSFQKLNSNRSTLMFVGDGEFLREMKSLSRTRSLPGIRFIGPVDYDNIAQYYAAADAFIMPTLEDNWSLVVPEAMSCGLPILCSKYNGCWPELVKSGENGWIFDPLEPGDTFRALQSCLDHKKHLKNMGAKSREIVSHFNPETAAKSILAACRIALERHNKGRKPLAKRQ